MTYAEKTIFNYASSCGDKRYVYRMWLIFRKNNQTTKNDSAEKVVILIVLQMLLRRRYKIIQTMRIF